MKSFLSFKSKSIISGALLIASFSLLSRLLGILRARIFAQDFGASTNLDIFYLSFRIPDLIFAILTLGGASSVLIPILSELIYKKREDQEKINKLISSSINLILLFVLVLMIVIILTLPYSINYTAPGLDNESKQKAIILTTIMLIQPLFLVVSDLFSSILQVHKIFISYSLAPVLYNIGIITGALFFTKVFGIYGLGIGVALGGFLHMLIHTFFFSKVGFKYRLNINFKDENLKQIIKLSLPRSIGLLLFQLNFLIINSLASKLGEGYVSILNYSFDIEYVPYGILGIAFATSSFAYLSQINALEDRQKFIATFLKSITQALYFIVPVTFIFFILREEIVKVLLFIGKFNAEHVRLTSKFIAITIFSIPFQALIPLFTKSFYAIKNTAIPIIVNGASLLITSFLAYYLGFILNYGFWGLAVALMFSGIINVAIYLIFIKHKIKGFKLMSLFYNVIKILIPTLFMSSFGYLLNLYLKDFLSNTIFEILIRGITIGGLSLIFYLVFSYFTKIEEALKIMQGLKKLVRK